MTTHELERELAAVLHRRAEDAMNDTDTQTELATFRDVVEGPAGSRPPTPRWLALAAATVAGAAAATLVALWGPGTDAERPEPAPAGPGQGRAADRAAAAAFATAYADHDADAVAALLAEGSEPWEGWRTNLRRDVAWDVDYLMRPCRRTTEATNGVVYTCDFAMHVMESQKVGRGPFRGNTLQVVVRDGEVTQAEYTYLYDTNGTEQHVAAVGRWIEEHHPEDAAFLALEEQDVPESEWPRWTRLTQRYSDAYAADVTSRS